MYIIKFRFSPSDCVLVEISNEEIKPRFLQAQKKFLEHGSPAAWSEMWEIALTLAGKMIHQQQKIKKFRMDFEKYEACRTEAAMYVLRRYRTYPERHKKNPKKFPQKSYFIQNIVKQMFGGVLHALYYRNENQKFDEKILLLEDLRNASAEKK